MGNLLFMGKNPFFGPKSQSEKESESGHEALTFIFTLILFITLIKSNYFIGQEFHQIHHYLVR